MSKISIIIPVYNTEKYLSECLESVINQTFTDLEIICVNDGSTDDSAAILENYKKKDERIKTIQLYENRGQSYARNRGIELSEGKYIYFLDSDDYIEENAMEILYNVAEKEKLDVIFFDTKLKYEDERFINKFQTYTDVRKGKYVGIKTGLELFNEFVINQEWTPSVPRQFWKGEFLKVNHLNFYEGIIHEDELFAFNAIMLALRAKYLNEQLFIRRFREKSTMTSAISDRNFYGYFTVFYFINKYVFQKKMGTTAIKKYLAILYGKVVRTYEMIKQNYDLLQGFDDDEIKNAYYFFVSAQNQYMAYGNFTDEAIRKIMKYEIVYVYGAGIVAKSVYEGLIRNNIIVQGFIVSKRKNNSTVFMSRPVVELEEVAIDGKSVLIVVAVNRKYQEEIESRLLEAGLDYMFSDKIEKSNL